MTTPPRTPDTTVPSAARRRGPNGRFLPREERATEAEILNDECATEPTHRASGARRDQHHNRT
ncbi:hypothetical protein ACFQFC_29595 [Amorphoplanes digitatis]|uniref:hypothetical protein n=1 Tax=Actinoplanes digitatis TaxID=1868 RepID=UPI00361B9626